MDFYTVTRAGAQDELRRWVMDGGDPAFRDERGYTPLHAAAWFGDVALIDALVQRGADVHGVDNYDSTALHVAATRGELAAVERLLALGADATHRTPTGDSPLFRAACYGYGFVMGPPHKQGDEALAYIAIAERLLAGGADPNHRCRDRYPLEVAALFAPVRMVEVLLAGGADKKLGNAFATAEGRLDAEEKQALLGRVSKTQATEMLLDLVTDLHEGCGPRVEALLLQGASPNKRDGYGWTALTYAVRAEDSEIVKLLLKYGAKTRWKIEGDPDRLDGPLDDMDTALTSGMNIVDVAKHLGYDDIVQLLEGD